MGSGKKIMVAGHICLDIAPKFSTDIVSGIDAILCPGKLVNVGNAIMCTGGAVSNTGIALAKLGADVILNAKIGDDLFGVVVRQLIGTDRAANFKTVSGQNTSYTIILAIKGCDRIFLHNPGTNDTFCADDIDYDVVDQCALFHFGYPPLMKRFYENQGDELVRMFRAVKAIGVTTSLDMSLPDPNSDSGKVNWARILERILPYVDVFMPSIEEIAFMLDKNLFEKRKRQAAGNDPVWDYTTQDYMHLSDILLEMGTKIIAIKSGIRGYFFRTGRVDEIGKAQPINSKAWSRRLLWASSYKAEQFGSATGAGDATIAGFLRAMVEGYEPETSLKIANTVGWENVRTIDALSGIEDWTSTLTYVHDKNRAFNAAGLDSYWKFSAEDCVFKGLADARE